METFFIIQRKNSITVILICTVCPGSSDRFYIESYNMNWVTTSWTYSILAKRIKLVTIDRRTNTFIDSFFQGGKFDEYWRTQLTSLNGDEWKDVR